MSVTFKVSKVEINTFNGGDFDHKSLYMGKSMKMMGKKQEEEEKKVIKTSIKKGVSKTIGSNSFVKSAFSAYSNHHELTIRPDDVWMAILVQFSLYINANSEQLRSKIVDFQGKKQLTVYGNGTLMSVPYETMIIEMTKEIEKNIKDPSIREWVNGKFTTSTPNDTIATSIALMSTMKSYFEYKMSLMCGLPQVTLLGTTDDWIDLKNRVEKLKEFEFKGNGDQMNKWTSMLLPICDEFISTSNNKPNLEWWNRIANQVGGGSGPRYLSGWITAFCVYDNDGKWVGDNKKTQTNIFSKEVVTSEWLFIDTNEIPKGYLFAPVLIDDNGTEYKTQFYAGHFAVQTSNDSKAIQPNIDWCILLDN